MDCNEDTLHLLRKLGFYINVEKSVLVPTQCIDYLGNIIDTNNMTISLPKHRTDKILQGCKELISKQRNTIREVAQITGLLVAATPAVS